MARRSPVEVRDLRFRKILQQPPAARQDPRRGLRRMVWREDAGDSGVRQDGESRLSAALGVKYVAAHTPAVPLAFSHPKGGTARGAGGKADPRTRGPRRGATEQGSCATGRERLRDWHHLIGSQDSLACSAVCKGRRAFPYETPECYRTHTTGAALCPRDARTTKELHGHRWWLG